jgi:hypothetical protein
VRGPKRASRDSGASSRAPTAGTASATPKPHRTTIATVRVAPSARPIPSTTEASTEIAIVNVAARPSAIPSGRRRPPVPAAESSAGSTGSTQGETAVPAPATNANTSRSVIGRQVSGAVIADPLRR